MPKTKKDIKYLNRDFGTLRNSLINFAKIYFPNTYNDFNESDPGMMFIEMSAYVGDVLSYYTDVALKESFITLGEEKTNIFNHAIALGYKPKNFIPATVDLDVFQLIPAKGTGNSITPDYDYSMLIDKDMVIKSSVDSDIEFRTLDLIDFGFSSSFNPTTVRVYQSDDITNEPTFYLLKKTVRARSGRIKIQDFTFDSPRIYDKILLEDTKIISILSIVDSDDNIWYEVPYLAQDTIFEEILNVSKNDPDSYIYRDSVPYLLKLKKTSRRFVTRFKSDGNLEIQFGAGKSIDYDEELVPDPSLVGNSLPGIYNGSQADFDPSNFLYTKTYGIAPSDTKLTVNYLVGNGLKDNVKSGELTNISSKTYSFPFIEEQNLDSTLKTTVIESLAVVNKTAASGGKNKEEIEETVNNALANFAAQGRTISKEDYIIRCYSLPSKFGSIAKAHIVQDDYINTYSKTNVYNPLALNLYVLGYDANKNLTQLNLVIKENLKNYISVNRMLTDAVNIKNAFIINIGINFEIMIYSNFNENEVLLGCIDKIKEFFNITKWQINQPILLSDVYNELRSVEGVRAVADVEVANLYDTNSGYSGNIYDIKNATTNDVIYPSLDPSIFELKYPNKNIKGRVINT